MTASLANPLYDKVRQYHETHGDDYGSEQSRLAKYRAVKGLLPAVAGKTLLDVGCGEERFRRYVSRADYTGIDLLRGENVLDLQGHWDLVVGNGIVYQLPDERAAKHLLGHCWTLTSEAFVWTSLDYWGHFSVGELHLDPYEMVRWARKVAGPGKVKLDMSYLPGDFSVLMLR